MGKKILILFVSVLLLSFVMANLGSFQQNGCVNIRTIENTSSVKLLSIEYPSPNSTLQVLNTPMTYLGGTLFNYTFCDTSQLGIYIYDYYTAENDSYVNTFEITPSGQTSTTKDAIIYSTLIIIFLCLCFLLTYFIIILPSENEKNDQGYFLRINLKKYIRIFLIAILYPAIIILFNLMTAASNTLFAASQFSGIFGFLFETMLSAAWIWTIVIIIWLCYTAWKDSVTKDLIKEWEGTFDEFTQ